MTAAAMIMGMLPMALGGSANAPLGHEVIGLDVRDGIYPVFCPLYVCHYLSRTERSQRQGRRCLAQVVAVRRVLPPRYES